MRHRERPDSLLAAAKICVLENDEDLDDFVVEIDILAEISHENVIKLYEAFFYQNKLWVRRGRIRSSLPPRQCAIFERSLNSARPTPPTTPFLRQNALHFSREAVAAIN